MIKVLANKNIKDITENFIKTLNRIRKQNITVIDKSLEIYMSNKLAFEDDDEDKNNNEKGNSGDNVERRGSVVKDNLLKSHVMKDSNNNDINKSKNNYSSEKVNDENNFGE